MHDQDVSVAAHDVTCIHNLPQEHNPYFTGRRQVLVGLGKSLSGQRDGGPVLAVYGNGGIGKTEVVLEFAHLSQDRYGLIWWLPADEPSTLAWHYSTLAERLGVAKSDSIESRRAVHEALKQRTDWLLIFDNAPDAESVRPYLPPRTGHVLITSRNSKWHGLARSFCLRVLDRPEAIDFLLRRTGQPADPAAATLAQALGNLPLALEQAGAMIEQTGISFSYYLRQFEEHWAELLQSGRSSGDYPDSVAMTWELACREVERANLDASALLKILSYLAPAEVTRSFLRKATAVLPVPLSTTFAHSLALDGAIETLQRFSLVAANERAIFVHHFVGALSRDRMPDEQQRNWCEVALEMMQKTFVFDSADTRTWSACAEALPHAMAAVGHAEAAGVAPGQASKLLNQVGEYLQQIGQYEQCRVVLERALELSDKAYGTDNPRRSAIINNLGRVLRRLGDVQQARAYFEAALALDERAYGESHPHVAEIVNNYGTVLYTTGDLATALQQFEWALEICRTHYGPEHPKVATVANNVAYAHANGGDLNRALDHFTRALQTAETACGPNHPLVASIRTNLGIALRLKGETEAAHVQFERAAAIAEATLGPAHSDLARSLGHLGAIHLERGELEPAREKFQRALEIDERALGSSHLMIIARLNDLGRCLKLMGDVDGSAACYERAAEILRKSRGAA